MAGSILSNATSTDNENVQTRDVEKITVHEDWYSSDERSGDLAILQVKILEFQLKQFTCFSVAI